MSVKAMAYVWEEIPSIKGNELLVALALADAANPEGVCWPSLKRVAKMARCSETTVERAIRKLIEERELQVFRGGFLDGKNQSATYRLVMGRQFDATPPERADGATPGSLRDATPPSAMKGLVEPSVEPTTEPSSDSGASGQLFPTADPKPEPAPEPEVPVKVQEVWDHYIRVFADRKGTKELTKPRLRMIVKALAAVNDDHDMLLRAVDGLKAYRAAHPDGSQRTDPSVIFETTIHTDKNLTDWIEMWASSAADSPTVMGKMSGIMKSRAMGVLKLIKSAREHPNDENKREKAQIELDWLRSKGYDVKIVDNIPTLVTKA